MAGTAALPRARPRAPSARAWARGKGPGGRGGGKGEGGKRSASTVSPEKPALLTLGLLVIRAAAT
jgi:hypothetical protein